MKMIIKKKGNPLNPEHTDSIGGGTEKPWNGYRLANGRDLRPDDLRL